MALTYAVVRTLDDWTVLEDGSALVAFGAQPDAIEMAQLLTLSAKAAGRQAAMVVQGEGGALRPWDVEHSLFKADGQALRANSRIGGRPARVELAS